MFGKKLNKNVTDELERRKRALDRLQYKQGSYDLSEMMLKTTYARLVSPRYKNKKGSLLEMKGRLLAADALGETQKDVDNFVKTYWNTTGDKRGFVPPAGISNIRTAYTGDGATINTIKEADITLRLFSIDQYNLIVPYYVRIGTILYLEFGWTNPKLELEKQQAYPRDFLKVDLVDGEPIVSMNLDAVQQYPDEFAINTNGNSDLFVGTVTNYDAKMQEDGGFEINISMKTTGHSMYYSPTYGDSRTNIKILTDTQNPQGDNFKHNMDERSGPIMLSKAKLLIQNDFNLSDSLKTTFDGTTLQAGVEGNVDVQSSSFLYVDAAGSNFSIAIKKMQEIVKALENKGFIVQSHAKGKNTYGEYHSLVAIHKLTSDLIITLTYVGEVKTTASVADVETPAEERQKGWFDKIAGYFGSETRTLLGWKINYYCSMRYIEDGILSRIFGIVNDKNQTITAGIRSLFIPKGADLSLPVTKTQDVFKSNKMLTHEFLVPKNFNQVLIATEAMSSILQRNGTGMFKSDLKQTDGSGWNNKEYGQFTKELGRILYKYGLPFLDKTNSVKSSDETPDDVTNPHHLPAEMRHMYVNIELVQEAFLGSENINFFNRQYFPTAGDDSNQFTDNDTFFRNSEIFSYFVDKDIKFNKEACAKTLKEGLYNMWNSIASNFHNFPNFEVGANIHLPNFLQVYDLRYTKSNEYYEFDVFNKDSIIKSLEFSSQVPTTVQLAATFGASTTFDFDSLLGGNENGIKEDLAQELLKNEELVKPTGYNNLLSALSYEGSGYIGGQSSLSDEIQGQLPIGTGTTENTTGLTQGIAANTIQPLDLDGNPIELPTEEIDELRNVYVPELGERQGYKNARTIKELRVNLGKGTTYPLMGISPAIIQGTPESIDDTEVDEEQRIRNLYPNINQQFSQLGDTLTNIFRLTSKGSVKNDNQSTEIEVLDENGEITKRKVSVDLKSGKVSGLTKNSSNDPLLSFTTTYGTLSKDLPGQRGASILEFGTHSDYQAYLDYLIFQDEKESLSALNGTISYFELSFTIDGISGILPGEAFTISYLPDLIKEYFYFIVKNVEQTCTNGEWTTTITALQRRKYFNVKDRKTLSIGLSNFKREDKKKKGPPVDIKALLPPQDNRRPGALNNDVSDAQAELPEEIAPVQVDQGLPDPEPVKVPVPNNLESANVDAEIDALGPIDPMFLDGGPLPEDPVWNELPPKVKTPFIPYEISESPQAEIVLSWTDGQAQVTTTPGPDEQQFIKVYPEGDKNNTPIGFTLGVTDILSTKEYESIKLKYTNAFGGKATSVTINDILSQQYERISIKGPDRDPNADVNYGQWDTDNGVYFYAAKRAIGGDSNLTVSQYLNQMLTEANVIGNDSSDRANSNTEAGIDNFYVDDIIRRILDQPQRTRITILEVEEPEVEEEPVVLEPEPIPEPVITEEEVEPETPNPPIVAPAEAEPEVPKTDPIPPEPVQPYLSTYQNYRMNLSDKLNQNSKYLYRVVGDMNGWRVETGRPARLIKTKSFYGERIEDAVSFKIRQKFWNEMIEAPNPGGITDDRKVQERVKELIQSGEFRNPRPGQSWVPLNDIHPSYDPANDRKAKAFAKDNKGQIYYGEE